MKTFDQIKQSLDSIEFISVEQWLTCFLQAFDIPSITINKIQNSFERGAEYVSLYRRAIFVKNDNPEDIPNLISKYRDSYPIVLFLGKGTVSIFSKNQSILGQPYSEISEYLHLLDPIRKKGNTEKDLYATLDFAPIVGELYSQLVLNNNLKSDAFNYVINLITISFVDQITETNIFQRFYDWMAKCSYEELDSFVYRVVKNGNFQDYFVKLQNNIIHTERTKELTLKLINSKICDIDPEVFGSLVYKIFSDNDEITLYGNQTAKSNVDKVLFPLFINPILELSKKSQSEAVQKLLDKVFFDPTNSPGCFLTEAFTKVYETLLKISDNIFTEIPLIDISNFIALVDNFVSFRLTKLNLFIVYLQYISSIKLIKKFDVVKLFNSIKVTIGNQLSIDWNSVCPNRGNVYVIGSPKFKGNRKLSVADKEQMKPIFGKDAKLADTDFCASWLVKGARYIENSESEIAFVLTNSVCQGSQVASIWSIIYNLNCHISFAYTPFKWANSDNKSIAVTVIAVGLKYGTNNSPKLLFNGSTCFRCDSIGPYLVQNSELIVHSRTSPISNLPVMRKGNMEYASGALIIEQKDYNSILRTNPEVSKYIKKLKGSEEFINNSLRYCIWIKDEDLCEAESINFIRERINLSRTNRASTTATQTLKSNPHRFRETFDTPSGSQTLLVPSVSSENREYIPMGFIYEDTIISNLAFAVYKCKPWVLTILESKMHHLWVGMTCGQLESRFRYSNVLGYNTFPIPQLNEFQINNLNELALELIRVREEFCEMSIGDLYKSLPPKLRNIHSQIDNYVDSLYSIKPLFNEYDRLIILMKLYTELINKEND